MKILCIEDGSVDLEELSALKDGGVIVYRQGSTPPKVIEISKQDNYEEKVFVLESKITSMSNALRNLVQECVGLIKDYEHKKMILIKFYDTMKSFGIRFH